MQVGMVLAIKTLAATVDILSDGRLDLICGSGAVEEEFRTWGIDPRARWGRLFEGMEVIRRSLSETEFDYPGKHFTYPGVKQSTKPVQQPFPLWVGDSAPSSSTARERLVITRRVPPASGRSTCRAWRKAGSIPRT